MIWRRCSAASAVFCLIFAAAQADAQRRDGPAPRIAPPALQLLSQPVVDSEPLPRVAEAAAPRPAMLGAMWLSANAELGIGRYAVGEIARPRTHLEAERHPTDVRRAGRNRGIAGLGLSVRF